MTERQVTRLLEAVAQVAAHAAAGVGFSAGMALARGLAKRRETTR